MEFEIGSKVYGFGILEKRNDDRLVVVCRCGKVGVVKKTSLINNLVRDCGCGAKVKDGRTAHPLHTTWAAMIHRCHDETNVGYHNYGGRGIKVCLRWRLSFWTFAKDVGERPEGKTLDRVDSDGDYGPSNIRWATSVEQSANKRKG